MIRGWFTIAYQPEKQPKWDEIRKRLMDRSNPMNQASALEQLVLLSYSETIPPHLLMPVVQYTATTSDHRVIKLLLIFLENCDTRDSMGKMRPEFILITDAIRKLLLHPNEYIRGAALRFLYKVNDTEILSQLMSPILTNLSHHNEYVRRHAAILVGRLARDIPQFTDDLSESIIEVFSTEADQRTLIAMLYSAYQGNPREAANLTINMNQFFSTDMKLAILNVAIKTYRNFPQFRAKFLETVVDFCDDESVAVRLQSAFVLRQLSNSPAAIRATANAYCELLSTIVDENLRAFVVQELLEMIDDNRSLMAPFALEMAQGTNVTGNLRTHLLNELVNLVTEENSAALVPLVASKEDISLEALKRLLLRFPATVCSPIAEQIGNFVNDSEITIAEPSSVLLKDCGIAGARKEAFRIFASTLEISSFQAILSRAIWSVAEFCEDVNTAADILAGYADFSEDTSTPSQSANTAVNEDGIYVTKTQVTREGGNLRSMLQEGDSYLALSLISALIRLKLRGSNIDNIDQVVKSVLSFTGVEKNARDICNLWLSACKSGSNVSELFEKSSKNSFYERSTSIENNKQENVKIVKADEPLQFSVLLNQTEAVPISKSETKTLPIVQLTGPSDTLYVEANCSLRKFDRVYHFYIYNRTESTLTNILFEFTTIGSVSILQRNDLMSLAPNGSSTFDLPVMISSGSCGTLFGAVSFDFAGASGSDHQLLPLSPIEIDPFFCFEPAPLSQTSFREKWSESVWERKIDIQTDETDLLAYLKHISTNFKFNIITPMKQIEVTANNAGFIAANLFTRSLFNEEVEANLSAKIDANHKITGFIRIRSPDEQLAFLFGKLIQ
ncbi:hypothetical protein M9Y10_028886 [Tritrichomonas musculus]|uniref:Coatomer subunit beta n=1 Tax=Tritrichomonas musculus TaxID=1915356 RepID=A0ABR2KLQ3_9EUKA